jgi:hydroxymethylpyrimidine pyrophosphatase-like HAD family hydrolase
VSPKNVKNSALQPSIRMIAIDLDGTLLGADGQVSARNLAALKAAEELDIALVIATGRRHCYAMKVVRGLGLADGTPLVSSNGAVVRTFGSELIERMHMATPTAEWLCGHLGEFRNALVITFDKVGPDGEDARGALVVEEFEDLHTSIGRWMTANEPYIEHIKPIERSLGGQEPIQMMLCGTVERMRRAEARMLEHEWVAAVGETRAAARISLNRTEYPARDLSIVDILPAGCSKGAALLRLAGERGIDACEIMAIGDNWNDISMLGIAGHPVLMGNAPADLIEMAIAENWHLTSSHHEDGVAEAIERHLPARDLLIADIQGVTR